MEINTQLPMMTNGIADVMNVNNSQFCAKGTNNGGIEFDNAGAYTFAPNIMNSILNFDSFADKFVNIFDKIGTAKNTYAQMREQGQCLCDLINKAHEEGRSEEEINSINAEIASRVDDIEKFYKGAMFNGVSPFEQPFGITIPDWQNMLGVNGADGVNGGGEEKEITELLTSVDFNFDMSVNVDGKTMNIGAQATINIGYTEDGALQITVDASMDYDLSGIVESGAESENALDIITRFLSLLDGKQNDLDFASNFLDKIFEKASTSLDNFKYLFPEVSGADSSTSLQGTITQHASITLDGANQIPNIAINIL